LISYTWHLDTFSTDTSLRLNEIKFSSSGLKQIRLETLNTLGCKDTFEHEILIKNNPIAQFDIDKDKQCSKGNIFYFSNRSQAIDDSINVLEWKISDGFNSNFSLFSHSFASEDTFSVRLVSFGYNGCSDTIYKPVVTFAYPVIDFVIPNDSQCWQKNEFTIFNNTKLKYGKLKSTWKFGDGTQDTAFEPASKFYPNKSDNYILWYVVETENGCRDSASHPISLLERPISQFTINDSVQCFNGNTFDYTSTTTFSAMNTLSYFWEYGNGDTSIGQLAKTVAYSSPGNKAVQLIAYSYLTNCYDTTSKSVLVAVHPVASFQTRDSQCYKGNSFNFLNTTNIFTGKLNYLWDFGDLIHDTLKSPTHKYLANGEYAVRLIAYSEHDCSDTSETYITVLKHPIAGFYIDDSSQCQNSNSFNFTDQSINSYGKLYHTWYYDADSIGNTQDIFLWKTVDFGNHTFKLIVSNSFGCKDTTTKKIYIEKYKVTKIINSKSDTQCLAGNLVDLSVNISDPLVRIQGFDWQLGDGEKFVSNSINYSYSAFGDYLIELRTISENGCRDTVSLPIRVLEPPVARFEPDTSCFPENIELESTSNFITFKNNSFLWNFSDGGIETDENVSHFYSASGSYVVSLVVTDSFGCKDTMVNQVLVYPKPAADFSFIRLPDTKFNTAEFQMNDLSTGGVNTWDWKFDQVSQSSEKNPAISFEDSNSRRITLIVTNKEGCKDTITKNTGTLYTEIKLLIPDCFSPNGDGSNEVYKPQVSPFVSRYRMEIFNRWGERVFYTDDVSQGWDGTYQGEACEQGVYICIIYLIPKRGGIQSQKVSVTLLR
jgi:gliding motility-associated-like protein